MCKFFWNNLVGNIQCNYFDLLQCNVLIYILLYIYKIHKAIEKDFHSAIIRITRITVANIGKIKYNDFWWFFVVVQQFFLLHSMILHECLQWWRFVADSCVYCQFIWTGHGHSLYAWHSVTNLKCICLHPCTNIRMQYHTTIIFLSVFFLIGFHIILWYLYGQILLSIYAINSGFHSIVMLNDK